MRKLRCVFSVFMVIMIVTVMTVACGSKAHEKEQKTAKSAEGEKKSDNVEKPIKEIEEEEAKEANGVKGIYDEPTEEDIKNLKDTIRDTVISDYLTPNNIPPEEFQWPTEEWAWQYFGLIAEIEVTKFTPEDDEIDICNAITIPSDQMYLKDLMDTALQGVRNWLDTQGEFDVQYYGNVKDMVLFPYEEFFNTIEF